MENLLLNPEKKKTVWFSDKISFEKAGEILFRYKLPFEMLGLRTLRISEYAESCLEDEGLTNSKEFSEISEKNFIKSKNNEHGNYAAES